MTLSICQIHPVFVGEVSGVDLTQPLSREEVAAIEAGTQARSVSVHRGDLVMWDNRQTMHRVRRHDESQPRDMRRTTVARNAPTTEQV